MKVLSVMLFVSGLFSAYAATAPTLGTVKQFAVLAASTATNTGDTKVVGDLGVYPGSTVTGFSPPGESSGALHLATAVAEQAQLDLTTAFNTLTQQPCDFDLSGKDLGGLTLLPGVFCFSSSAQLTGELTLVGGASDTFIFKIGTSLNIASASIVAGTPVCNVFWQIGSSATLGTGSQLIGNIMAQASVTLNTDAKVYGRALARTGAVTMDTNLIVPFECSATPPDSSDDTPVPPVLPPGVPPPAPAEETFEIDAIGQVSSCEPTAQVVAVSTSVDGHLLPH